MADCKKYEVYGNPTLQQGGWERTGEGNNYIQYADDPQNVQYPYRICTLDYVPRYHPTQITITGIASKELDVSIVVLRSDNYIIAALSWQDNGYTFNLGSTYDKLGVMFRFKNGDTITPNDVTFDKVEAWQHSLRKFGTSTDTITTLPADIYVDGNNATVSLKGNMQQNGTPTPDNPIQPQETGERTENLFDVKKATETDKFVKYDGTIETGANGDKFLLQTIQCQPDTQYTFSWKSIVLGSDNNTPYIHIAEYDSNNNFILRNLINCLYDELYKRRTITTSSQTVKLDIRYDYNSSRGQTVNDVMLNTGSTALPYEPYGYKLDISSANTTTPVYLGEVESTRQIKKLVLTGKENWIHSNTGFRNYIIINDAYANGNRETQCFCSHYLCIYNGEPIEDVPNNSIYINLYDNRARFFIKTEEHQTEDSFKSYLAQQYENGTPVTVWYVLATPETGIINEPIRKIGDYADTVSGIAIPTSVGKDTIDVNTTVKPSEVSLEYNGWHDANVKEFDGTDWN